MARWIDDGSSGFKISGNVVTFKDEEGVENAFNCLWKEGEGVTSGKHYWKIRFQTLEGVAGVGVTSKDYFKQGFECKSLQYSSDLTDGCHIFVPEFGPPLGAGDVIGIFVSFEDNELKVYFDVNGISLGKAFVVDSRSFESIYPMVSFHNSGSATCERVTDVPTVTRRVRSLYFGIEGNWSIKSIEENGIVTTELANTLATTKLIQTKANEYSWSLSAFNEFIAILSKEGGTWKTSEVMCSHKLCPSSWKIIEEKLSKLLENVKVVENGDDNNTLSIKSDTISTFWTRDCTTPSFYANKNPFKVDESYSLAQSEYAEDITLD